MIKRLLADRFIRDNIVYFSGAMIIAVLNYAYHPVLGRLMSVEDFGEVEALLSMSYLTGILLTVFGTIATHIGSNHGHRPQEEASSILSQTYRLAAFSVGVFSAGLLVLSPWLMRTFHFSTVWPFVPLSVLLLSGVPYTFYSSYLRGLGRFGDVSVSGILTAGGKLVFALALVWAGLGVFGAILALALSSILAQAYVTVRSRGVCRLSLLGGVRFTEALRAELGYGLLILVSLGYATFLYASDVIAAKYFFDAETAGRYSAVATVARIIYFAISSVAMVLLPAIKMGASAKEHRAVMQKAFAIVALMGACSLVLFVAAPGFILSSLMGERYGSVAGLLPLAGLYLFLASLVNVFYTYFLALRDTRLYAISAVGVLVTGLLVVFHHASPTALVTDYAIGATVTLVPLVFGYLRQGRSRSGEHAR